MASSDDLPCARCVRKREWRRDLVLFGALLIVLFGVGFATLSILIDRIEAERSARFAASAVLVRQVCERDNAQDRILAAHIRDTIEVAPPEVDRVFAEVLQELAANGRSCGAVVDAYVRGIR